MTPDVVETCKKYLVLNLLGGGRDTDTDDLFITEREREPILSSFSGQSPLGHHSSYEIYDQIDRLPLHRSQNNGPTRQRSLVSARSLDLHPALCCSQLTVR